jgi:ABC-type sulfate transport system substrate-binding protein
MAPSQPFRRSVLKFAVATALAAASLGAVAQKPIELLNVSYDPTRELYVEFNAAFAKHWKAKTGQDVTIKQSHGGSAQAKEFIAKLYANVPVLDTGARGSSITFAQRNQGDVFISWENEAFLLEKEFGNKIDVIYPSLSILAEPAVTVVDKNVDKKGTRAVAQAYLEYLYTDEGQDIAGKNFYRPISEKFQAKYVKQLPKIKLFTIEEAFGGWAQAAKDHFVDGTSFDQIYAKK